jgi:histidinol-phosphatase (PHP family)
MGFAANYHTHTWRCQHATGDVGEYARVALAGGCRVLGISDHTPMPDGRWRGHRMNMSDLQTYEAAIAEARRAYPELVILKGLECELVDEFVGFYRDELLGRRHFDYLIGACHFTPYDGDWLNSFEELTTPSALRAYADYNAKTMASGLFTFISHPDIIGCCNAEWNADLAACARDICAASVANKVPLELNGYGLRKEAIATSAGERAMYPWLPFWQIAAEVGVEIVLSSDAHDPEDTLAGYETLAKIRDTLGLREADLSGLARRADARNHL